MAASRVQAICAEPICFRKRQRLKDEVLPPACPPCIPDMYISAWKRPMLLTSLDGPPSPSILVRSSAEMVGSSLAVPADDASKTVIPSCNLPPSQKR